MRHWIVYFFCIFLTEFSGLVTGMLTRDATVIYTQSIVKPPLSPPPAVFPVVWTFLYALMGIGLARILLQEAERHLSNRRMATWIYFAQLFFNLGWCYVFFLYQMFGVAFAWLLILFALVIAMTIVFFKQDKVAGLIQLPYIFWMFFAAYLNAGVFLLNR